MRQRHDRVSRSRGCERIHCLEGLAAAGGLLSFSGRSGVSRALIFHGGCDGYTSEPDWQKPLGRRCRVREPDKYMARPFDRSLRQPHRSSRRDHVRVRQHAHQNPQRHRILGPARRVGSARDHEDQNERYGYVPKLMLAGRLVGTLDGRPVVIAADDSGLVVTAAAFQTAWAGRRSVRSLLPVLGMLKRNGIPVRVSVGGLVSLEVLPSPNPLMRILMPELARLH